MPARSANTTDEPDGAPARFSARQGVVVGLTLYALAILIAGIAAGLGIGPIIGTLFFVGLGAVTVSTGLGLSREAQAHRPRFGESDFIWKWMVHLLPLRLARAWTVLLGCVFLAAGWYIWSVNRPLPTAEPGRYTTNVSTLDPGFSFSFNVAGDKVRNAVLAWRAQCASGATFGTSVQSDDTPTTGWSSGSDYVLDTANGGIVHVHTISDTGHFRDSHTATGLLSLTVTIDRDGQAIDHCTTGAVRWVAHRQGPATFRN